MKTILYVDNNDVVGHARHLVDDMKIDLLMTEARHKAYEVDVVVYTTPAGFQIILKDRGRD